MDFSIYQNAWRIYKSQFGRLTSFIFSLITIFSLCVVCYVFVSQFDFYLSCILLCAFVFLPLLYSFQLIVGMVSAGRNVEYGDFYRTYKVYFSPAHKGTYSAIMAVLLSGIISILMVILSLTLYDFIFPDIFETTFNPYLEETILTIDLYDQLIVDIINMPGYKYFLISFLAFPFLFLFSRLEKNFMVPYFNLILPLPSILIKRYMASLLKKHEKEVKRITRPGKLFFSLAFLFGFIGFGCLGCVFSNYFPNLSIVLILALAGGLLCSLVFIVPLMITSCFVADSLHNEFLGLVYEKMLSEEKLLDENSNLDEENKKLIKTMIEKMKNDIKKREEQQDSSHNDDQQ